jgi:phage portal protein BeeE
MDRTVRRIYSFYNTNEKIVSSSYSENDWIAYYESTVEPDVIQISEEFTRKIFSRRERAIGNFILCEAASLQYASMSTKLSLTQFVDRGLMTPNEVRALLSLPPVDGGDVMVRRLDTVPVETTDEQKEGEDG